MQHRLTSVQDNRLCSQRVGDPSGHHCPRGAYSAPNDAVPKYHKGGSKPGLDPNTLLGSSDVFHDLPLPEYDRLRLRGRCSKEHY